MKAILIYGDANARRWFCSSGAAVMGKGKSEQRSGAGVCKVKVELQDLTPSVRCFNDANSRSPI